MPPPGCKGKGKGGVGHQAIAIFLTHIPMFVKRRRAQRSQDGPKCVGRCILGAGHCNITCGYGEADTDPRNGVARARLTVGHQKNLRLWSKPREQRRPGLSRISGSSRVLGSHDEGGLGPRSTPEITYTSGRSVSATSGRRRSSVGYHSSGASKTPRSREGLPVAASVPLGRELGRTAAARHEGDGSVGRTASVHELSALRWLTRRLAWWLIRWLCTSLRFGLGGILPGHA